MRCTCRKLQPALRAYLTTLREEAYIDIKSGYIDTGASAETNQTGRDYGQGKQLEELEKEEEARRIFRLGTERRNPLIITAA